MKAISVQLVSRTIDGKEIVRAVIASDDTPAALPTSGATVDGMTENQFFAPMSVICVIADAEPKMYVADEHGTFIAQ